jgi:endonuclease YncB( thermonuclease family)
VIEARGSVTLSRQVNLSAAAVNAAVPRKGQIGGDTDRRHAESCHRHRSGRAARVCRPARGRPDGNRACCRWRHLEGTRVRLWGIDAPETAQKCERGGVGYACGQQASVHLRSLIGEAGVSCQSRTKDRYGRTVAVCRAGTVDIGAAVVRDGWAMAFVRYSADYVAEEREARDAKRGLWGGSFMAPWDWRAAHRVRQVHTRENSE